MPEKTTSQECAYVFMIFKTNTYVCRSNCERINLIVNFYGQHFDERQEGIFEFTL
jgi:hypothetical protein